MTFKFKSALRRVSLFWPVNDFRGMDHYLIFEFLDNVKYIAQELSTHDVISACFVRETCIVEFRTRRDIVIARFSVEGEHTPFVGYVSLLKLTKHRKELFERNLPGLLVRFRPFHLVFPPAPAPATVTHKTAH